METMSTAEITYGGVERAAAAIAPELAPTPCLRHPLLDDVLARQVLVKHENAQPTGSFKIRGGLALAAELDPATPGLVTASTGNHAQSVAFAAERHGWPAVVVMPDTAPQNKIRATRLLGAEIVLHGAEMTAAGHHARHLAEQHGWRYVDPTDPGIVHGHATVTLEILRDHPELEAIYVPVGSGTGAAGACLVRDALAPHCRIIAVQSAQAPAAYHSWRSRRIRDAPCTTRASGLATATGYPRTQRVLREHLDDFLLVEDQDIDRARKLLAYDAHTLVEGAGAAALAGLLADPTRSPRCAIIASGGNADADEIAGLADRTGNDGHAPTADRPKRVPRAEKSLGALDRNESCGA